MPLQHPDHWGNGYATKAGRLGLDFLIENKKPDYVVAFARNTNTASIHVLQKLGFQLIESATGLDKINRGKYRKSLKD